MKKKILLLAAVALCAAILASGTLAYFTADDQVHNVVTTGAVDIAIEEWQETDEGLVPYPKDEPVEVMPGVTISKIATIKNTEAEAYIRAKFEVEVLFVDVPQGETPSVDPNAIQVNVNEEDWVQKEGDTEWWYYQGSVESGKSTEPLFTEVTFDGPTMTNAYQNCTIDVIVSAQAVQAANNGGSAVEAAGWPAE